MVALHVYGPQLNVLAYRCVCHRNGTVHRYTTLRELKRKQGNLMIVRGEIAVMLGVLGLQQGDSRILDVIALVGPAMEVEEFDWHEERSTYFIFRPAGTDLLFENDVLVSAIVRTQPDSEDETYGLYPRPNDLVEGLPPTATRAEAESLLGKPERTGPTFDRYKVNGHYLCFEFDAAGHTAKLSVLLEPV